VTDDLNDFFSDNAKWVDSSGAPAPDPSEPPQPPKSRRDMRRRRKAKQRRHGIIIIASVVAVALIAVGGVFCFRGLKQLRAMNENDNQSQVIDFTGPEGKKKTFTIESGQGVDQIANNLVKARIVKSAGTFASAVSAADATLYPGSYQLRTHMKSADVVKILSDPSKAGGFAEVKAGERVSDVIEAAAKAAKLDVSEFKTIIDGGGDGILPSEAGGKFEGWLEPGSYDVQGKSAKEILKKMVDARIAKLDSLGVPTGDERERILNIASIAESEVGNEQYYGQVARVILNRIADGMPLGMDTTVAYGLGISASQLTDAQLNDSGNEYNTRIHKGLPPTPISNPGDNAILASMNPPEGKWMYFVTTNLQTGETKFVETEAEFWKIRDEYKNNNKDAN